MKRRSFLKMCGASVAAISESDVLASDMIRDIHKKALAKSPTVKPLLKDELIKNLDKALSMAVLRNTTNYQPSINISHSDFDKLLKTDYLMYKSSLGSINESKEYHHSRKGALEYINLVDEDEIITFEYLYKGFGINGCGRPFKLIHTWTETFVFIPEMYLYIFVSDLCIEKKNKSPRFNKVFSDSI